MSNDWANLITGVDLHLDLDASAGRRDGLERAVRDAIRAGRLATGTRLPATRALAAEIGISRNTVAAAYDQLIAEGYLQARTGAGTFVAGVPAPITPTPAPARVADGPRYDLRAGKPDVTTFPVAAWLRATRTALSKAPTSRYDYAPAVGTSELRIAIAAYLGRVRGVQADPERVLITSGAVQALALLTSILGGGGPATVAMEDPGLAFHRQVVRGAGGSVVALPTDDRGACTDRVPGSAMAAVLTPAHQYPIGVTLHPSRRHAAVTWARAAAGRLLIEDDYDGEFRFDRQPVGALQGMAPDHVVYIGTASKTLAPALRLAWMVVPEPLVAPLAEAKRRADMHTDVIGQLTLAELINSHEYDRHVRAMRLHYRKRRDALVERLGARLPLEGVAAGLHALIRLPDGGPTEHDVVSSAAAHGLGLDGLAEHWHRPEGRPQGVIVGYGTPGASAYPAALDILARVLRVL